MYHFSLKFKNRFELEEASPLVSFPTNIGYTPAVIRFNDKMSEMWRCISWESR